MTQYQPENIFPLLSDAIAFVKKNKGDGCICPCCGQIAKVYKRKLNNGMAFELISLYKLSKLKDDFYHHTKFAKLTGGEISKLSYWGLVIEKEKQKDEEDKKTSGYWAITEKGKLFAENKIRLKSHIFLYDAKLLGFSDTEIDIIESLGNKFNYRELMGETMS
jgi:hypothetical protein